MTNFHAYKSSDKGIGMTWIREREKFRHLIKNSFDIIVLLDARGVQYYVSESCKNILGYSPHELVGVPVIEQFIHPEDREATKKGLEDIIANRANGGAQYRHRHKNGGWVYLEAYGTNQIDNPAIGAVVLNVRDITDRKRAEDALKESERQLNELNATKDRFFSIIGHDIRSPFNSIVGFSDILIDQIRQKDYEGIEEYAGIIQNAAHQVMDLLTNLLEWSRSQTGTIRFNPLDIDLIAQIDEVVALFGDAARQKSIDIEMNLFQRYQVRADRDMINAIIRNLISNGIKFSRPGGKITIGAKQEGEWVIVSVADNGVGIPAEVRSELFRIDQGHTTPGTQSETGTGLGLLLCREFVEKHGGTIWVESEENKGSIFFFSLPFNN
ncbi:MAG: PAS domain-containing sensor histidine kinase [Marinilabilia sp.]